MKVLQSQNNLTLNIQNDNKKKKVPQQSHRNELVHISSINIRNHLFNNDQWLLQSQILHT